MREIDGTVCCTEYRLVISPEFQPYYWERRLREDEEGVCECVRSYVELFIGGLHIQFWKEVGDTLL